jgi:hypothetical protein
MNLSKFITGTLPRHKPVRNGSVTSPHVHNRRIELNPSAHDNNITLNRTQSLAREKSVARETTSLLEKVHELETFSCPTIFDLH